MTAVMTPSAKTITNGQIDKAVSNYRAMLEKHRAELLSESAQQVLGQPELAAEQFAVLSRRVEDQSDTIVRRVKVSRDRSPKKMLDATGRVQYTDRQVVDAIPQGKGEEADVYFFKLGRYVSVSELEREYERRGLMPDPYAQAAVNEADPTFADDRPNGSQWQNARGEYCFVTFGGWGGERGVDVDRRNYGWINGWWFAGVRK